MVQNPKGYFKRVGLVLGLLLLIGPYQNCTLHQSDARKFLEESGFSKGASVECLPYLTANKVVSFYGTKEPVYVGWEDDGAMTCLISVDNLQSKSGIDSTVCTFPSEDKALVMNAKNNSFPANFSSDRGVVDLASVNNAYGLWYSEKKGAGTILYFLGARSSSGEAVRCRFTFNVMDDFVANKGSAIERGEMLVSEIVRNFK